MTTYAAHYRHDSKGVIVDTQPLFVHLEETAAFAGEFAKKIKLSKLAELIGLLHDLGKYHAIFQNYLMSELGILTEDDDGFVRGQKGRVDHSTAGAQYIWQLCEEKIKEAPTNKEWVGVWKTIQGIGAISIASHHSGLIDIMKEAGNHTQAYDYLSQRMSRVLNTFNNKDVKLAEVINNTDASVLAKTKSLLDDTQLYQEVMEIVLELRDRPAFSVQMGFLLRIVFSTLIAGDRISSAEFDNPWRKNQRLARKKVGWDSLIERLEGHIGKFGAATSGINKIRADISNQCLQAASLEPGCYSLTVATGLGKTLASMRYALHHAKKYNMDRIVVVIPFTAIIDQNADVVRAILDPENTGDIVLEHHSNITPEKENKRSRALCEDWDAPIVFTTSVQYHSVFFGGGTRDVRRMHQLANSVIIFDEIQTLPIKAVHLFNNSINFLTNVCGSTVVLCTATQPPLSSVDATKGACAPTEIATNISEQFAAAKRVNFFDYTATTTNCAQIANLAMNQLDTDGNCLIICNTKKAAASIFGDISAMMRNDESVSVFHLSTNMCPQHRRDILAVVRTKLKQSEKVVCVSTQLIEAGVDVSFTSVIRTIAGLDSVAQAAGRCNRHGELQQFGNVFIVKNDDEKLGSLDYIKDGQSKTRAILGSPTANMALDTPAVQDVFFSLLYGDQDNKKNMVYSLKSSTQKSILNLLGSNESYRSKISHPIFKQMFSTAAKEYKLIDDNLTEAIVVPYGTKGAGIVDKLVGAYDLTDESMYRTIKEAQQYSVNVFPQDMKKLEEAGAFYVMTDQTTEIKCLLPGFYVDTTGVSCENGITFYNEPIIL